MTKLWFAHEGPNLELQMPAKYETPLRQAFKDEGVCGNGRRIRDVDVATNNYDSWDGDAGTRLHDLAGTNYHGKGFMPWASDSGWFKHFIDPSAHWLRYIEIVDGGAPEILMSTRQDHLQAVIEALGGTWP